MSELAVQYAKLPEWLLARRAIPEDYTRLLPGLEAKVNDALAEKVSDQAANDLISQHKEAMSYFAVKEVYDAVAKSQEGQAKSLLGGHTHPGAAKWKAALDAFRRKNLGWISVARILIQNVSYEIPALKRHVAACERQVQECSQRQTELSRSEANAKARHEKLLAELGILGLDVRRELRQTAADELPVLRAELVDLLQGSGKELLEYFEAYAAHAAGGAAGAVEKALPMLRVVVREGRKAKVEDAEVEIPQLRSLREQAQRTADAKAAAAAEAAPAAGIEVVELQPAEAAQEAAGGIDWGFGGAAEPAGSGGGISWDFEVTGDGSAAPAGGIDWGGIEVSGSGVEPASESGGIDWGGISFEGVELGGTAEDQGSGEEQSELLSDAPARELLYQDVAEVSAFLEVRIAELARASTVEHGPKGVDKSLADVKALAEVTSKAEELMAGRKTQRLLMLQSSDRYLEQQVKRIDLSKKACAKPAVQRSALDKSKAEQLEEAKRTKAEAEEMRQATRKLQRALEAELTTHFKTTVRIVGDIASI